jgi:hypothetical protein
VDREVDAGGQVPLVGQIGEKERVAFRVELQHAGKLFPAAAAKLEARFFSDRGKSLLFESIQLAAQPGALVGGNPQLSREFGLRHRLIFWRSHQLQDPFTQLLGRHG